MNDDFDDFMAEMEGVKPLAQVDVRKPVAVIDEVSADPSLVYRREAATAEIARDDNGLRTDHVDMLGPNEVLEYMRPGIQLGVYKKVRLGQYPIEARLDLHHKTVDAARVEVFRFIQECIRYDARSVLIVHGKGGRDGKHKAVIKSFLAAWLKELDQVMCFHSAQQHHGGTGAVYIMLRKSDSEKQKNREKHGLR